MESMDSTESSEQIAGKGSDIDKSNVGNGSDASSLDNSMQQNLFKIPSLAVKRKPTTTAKAFLPSESGIHAQNGAAAVTVNEPDEKSKDSIAPVEKTDGSATSAAATTAMNTTTTTSFKISKRNSKSKQFSPAEQLREAEVIIPYKEPAWGGLPPQSYSFEVVKNGTVVERVDLSVKSYHLFGRLPSCDHPLDHPSLSRHHAVVQFCRVPSADENDKRDIGWYLYDLDSTHGTWINKNKVPPRTYLRLRVGYVIKFGGSTRLFILQGPVDDQDDESELSIAELKQQRERQKKEAELLRQLEAMEAEELVQKKLKSELDVGCTWGFGEDAVENPDDEADMTVSAVPLNEDLYIEDPKKALRGYFEREGWDFPEYDFADASKGRHTCRVQIPIDTPSGEPVVAEVTMSGSRKDAVKACALEACRILDRHGLLRKSTHESRAKKEKNWEEADYYDSDEDTFLDRTGDIEKKREKRIQKSKVAKKTPETFESLSKKLEEVDAELQSAEEQIEKDRKEKQALEDDGVDALDAFMMTIKAGGMDVRTRSRLKHRCVELRQQKLHLERLLKIAKPCNLPMPAAPAADPATENKQKEIGASQQQPMAKPSSAQLPMYGKVKTSAVAKPVHKPAQFPPKSSENADDDVVEEEDEGDEPKDVVPESSSSPASATRTSSSASHPSGNVEKPAEKVSSLESRSRDVSSESAAERKSNLPSSDEGVQGQGQARKRKRNENVKVIPTSAAKYDDDGDPDIVTWVPPANQLGDGRTHLNEKFGY